MFLVRTSLRPSPIHGIGVFAAEPIYQGQVVWQFDPRIDLRIALTMLGEFPPAIQEYLKIRAYIEVFQGGEVMVLCADNAKFVNHSDHPNLIDSQDGMLEYAAWDISVDEELTCNYYTSDMAAAEKLGAA